MIVPIILLCLASVSLTDPPVFDNYFDDSIKEVVISLDSAILACLQNGDTLADKVKAAYDECFGKDYDFEALAEEGEDNDDNGLPDQFKGNEVCFYKKMGWVDASGKVDADAVKGDLGGLEAGLKAEFDGNIDKCATWAGSFASRKKREADDDIADIPAVMEKGGHPLNWVRSVIRKTRSAEPQNGNGNGEKNNKNTKNGKGKKGKNKNRSGKKGKGKGKKGKNKNRSAKKGKGKGKNKNRSAKKGKGKNKNRSGKKGKGKNKKRSGKKGKGKKRKNKNRNAKKGKGKGKNKNRSAKKGKGKGKKGKNKNRSAKKRKEGKNDKKEKGGKGNKNGNARNGNGSLDESTYNKLWCFDLSLEQVLEQCVENKIKN